MDRAFESAGLPAEYWPDADSHDRIAPTITTYLGAPNPINTLNLHLGTIIHVLIPPGHNTGCLLAACSADLAKTVLIGVSLHYLVQLVAPASSGAVATSGAAAPSGASAQAGTVAPTASEGAAVPAFAAEVRNRPG